MAKRRLKIILLAPVEIVSVSLYGFAIGFRDSLRNIRDAWREIGGDS